MREMMSRDLAQARGLLEEENYTCVLCKGQEIYTSTKRGVQPLVEWLSAGTDLHGFSAADKVIGKATAFLYVLTGVKEVYAPVMSEKARAVFVKYGIAFECREVVDAIINRAGTGICPMEQAVAEIEGPEEAYLAVRETLKVLAAKKNQ